MDTAMTTYTIVKEPYGQPHDAGTAEAIACEIAGSWLGFDRTGKSLRALSADSTYQSIVMLSESQLCTIFVDEERIAIWEKSLRPLAESINGHRASMHAIEQDLRQSSDSLAKLAKSPLLDERSQRCASQVVSQALDLGMYDLIESYMDCLEVYFDIQIAMRGAELMP